MDLNTLKQAIQNISGGSFMGLDTLTDVPLTGGKSNPQQGRVQKRTTGSVVMAFTHEKTNAYDAMVKRRLEAEGKDPNSFQIQPRAWGERVPGFPLVEHKGNFYLEVIFLHAGKSEYLLDGNVVDKSQIQGLKEATPGNQGGLENKVFIRDFKVSSITEIRADGTSYK